MRAEILGSVCGSAFTHALASAGEALRSAAHGDGFVVTYVGAGPPYPFVAALIAGGISTEVVRDLHVRVGDDPLPFEWSPERPLPRERAKATSWHARPSAIDDAALRARFERAGVVDQARRLIYDGRSFLGVISVERGPGSEPFSDADLGWIDVSARVWVPQLVAARAFDADLLDESSALLFDARGECLNVSMGATRWARASLVSAVGAAVVGFDSNKSPAILFLEGVELRIARLESNGERRYLVRLRPTDQPIAHPTSELSDLELDIAARAANGSSVDQIAAALRLEVPDVRTRLGSIFDTLGVFSRAALRQALDLSGRVPK